MPKVFAAISLLLFLPVLVYAFSSAEVVNYGAPESFIYKKQFDQLVLDLVIPSGQEGAGDTLETIILENDGTAQNFYDIAQLILWADSGEAGFQGMGIDNKIGIFESYENSYRWRLMNLDIEVPAEGLRLFISAEIASSPTVGRFIQMRIPALLDNNQNGQFDFGDRGIFLQSGNNGPQDDFVLNPHKQTIRGLVSDNLAPKAVIVSPAQNEEIATSTYLVKGLVRDQGGSSIKWLKIGMAKAGQPENVVWQEAQLGEITNQEQAWQYQWQNIEQGEYILKTKAADWVYGEGESEREVAVKVVFPAESIETPPVIPISPITTTTDEVAAASEEVESSEEVQPSKEAQIAGLKAQIQELQLQIINLLKQLIALLQIQLGL